MHEGTIQSNAKHIQATHANAMNRCVVKVATTLNHHRSSTYTNGSSNELFVEHCDQGSLGRRRLPPADPSFGNNYASEITDFATTGYNRNPRGSARAVLGKRDGGLSDEMTLEYYGISHGTVLTVLQKIRVTIRIANNHFLGLIVNEDITVGTLKDYLRDQHGMDDIENKALEMEYEGKLVALDDRTYLWAAGIEEGTALSLVRA